MGQLPWQANNSNDSIIVVITVGASTLENVRDEQVSHVSGKECLVLDIYVCQKEPSGPLVDIVTA